MSARIDDGTRRWLLAAWALCLVPLLLQLAPVTALATATVGALTVAMSWRHTLPSVLKLTLIALAVGAVVANYPGIGRDTGCALLAALLAIKPAETATVRDARSLVGFALFAPFSTFLLDAGPASLALGFIAALVSLLVLLRLSDAEAGLDAVHWSPRQALLAIGRLALTGLPLALAAFWLFPRLPGPLWGLPDRTLSKPGLSERMTPGQWLDALNDDTVAMRIRFTGIVPARSEMYWRGAVLWDFDGATWLPAPGLVARRAADLALQPPRWRYIADVEPTDDRLLALLEFPASAPTNTQRSADGTLHTTAPMTALTRWQMDAAPMQSFAADLPLDERQRALALPRGFNPRTVALGQQWRREAGGNDRAIILRALNMVHAGFAYSLTVPPPGRNWIDDFVFEGKVGYCQQFSTAFVVEMRAAGIPARIVTGYAGGYHNPVGDYWVVRNSDAHAWAEAWLPGQGWTRVDPTAAVAPDRIYDTLADRAPGAAGALGRFAALRPVWEVSDNLRRGWNDFVLGFNADTQARMFSALGIQRVTPETLLALFAFAMAIALGWMLWLLARGERVRDPLLRAWHALDRRYARKGLGREPDEPAEAWAQRAGEARPTSRSALLALARRFSGARYAPGTGSAERASLARDLRRHRP